MAVETPSLLIVHQNPNMAKTLATLLSEDYDIYIARQASQVSQIIESTAIHLVLATQQLPDSTGLVLFSELRRNRPHIVRILIVDAEDKRNIDIGDAISREVIHRYLEEPLTSSIFLEAVRRGIQLCQNLEPPPEHSDLPPDAEQEDQGERLEAASEESMEEPGSEASATEASEAESLHHAGQAYGSMQQERERQQALAIIEEKQTRIENLEAIQKQLIQEKEELLDRLVQAQKENMAMTVLRQENVRLTEENTLLKDERQSFEQRIASLETQSEELRGELEGARGQLSSLGMLQDLGSVNVPTPAELRETVDPLEIYEKSAEWCMQFTQLRKLCSILDLKVHRADQEISELHEQIAGLRTQFDREKMGLMKKISEYEEQYHSFRQELEAQTALCDRLEREKEELAGKLL
jgi:DNA-binding response OmpR family regulator